MIIIWKIVSLRFLISSKIGLTLLGVGVVGSWSLLENLENRGLAEIIGQLLEQIVKDSYPSGPRDLWQIAGECNQGDGGF